MSMGQTRPVACTQTYGTRKCKGTTHLVGNVRRNGHEVALIFRCSECKHEEEVPQG